MNKLSLTLTMSVVLLSCISSLCNAEELSPALKAQRKRELIQEYSDRADQTISETLNKIKDPEIRLMTQNKLIPLKIQKVEEF